MNDILSDIEKEKVIAFCADATLFEAVRKVLLVGIYQNGTLKPDQKADATRNFALNFDADSISNEDLGAALRARTEGIRIVEMGFGKLESFKATPEQPIKKKNKAF